MSGSTHIKVKLVKSVIGATDKQKANIKGLGLKRIGQESTLLNIPPVRGMIKKMINWLEVSEVQK